jgi:hypothetical protein
MDTNDFFTPVMPRGRGGARPGSGPKPKAARAQAESDGEQTPYQQYEKGRAAKEQALARKASVEADIAEGLVVSRAAVQAAAAKAFAMCSQSLDAIADNLERQLAVPPEIAEKVAIYINEAKAQLAEDLKNLGGSGENDDLFA